MRLEHLSVLALAGCVAALPTADRCDDLWTAAPKHLANLEVIVTRSYEGESWPQGSQTIVLILEHPSARRKHDLHRTHRHPSV